MAIDNQNRQVERGLAGRVSEEGVPPPRVLPKSAAAKRSGTTADVLLEAGPLLALAIPGVGPYISAGLAVLAMPGKNARAEARARYEGNIAMTFNAGQSTTDAA